MKSMAKIKKAKPKPKVVLDGHYLDPVQAEIQAMLAAEEGYYYENEFEGDFMPTQLPMIVKKGSKGANGGVNGYGGSFASPPNSPSYFQGGSAEKWVHCKHEGDTVVWEKDGKALYAASWQGLDEYSDEWDLIIDLAGNVRPKTYQATFVKGISTATFADELQQFCPQPHDMSAQLLSLDWADMGIPPVKLAFWQALWNAMPAKTVVACMGGHGRTGTCLAAILIVAGDFDHDDAIDHIKTHHCNKAVESFAQEKYLHGLYVEKLKWDQAVAVFEGREADAADILLDIAHAEQNPPKVETTVASKPKGSLKGTTTYSMGEIISSRLTANGWEDERCTNDSCSVYKCDMPAHLTWVPRTKKCESYSPDSKWSCEREAGHQGDHKAWTRIAHGDRGGVWPQAKTSPAMA